MRLLHAEISSSNPVVGTQGLFVAFERDAAGFKHVSMIGRFECFRDSLFDQQDGHMISRFRTVVGGERGAYRLVYKSSNLKGDGKFHVVRLKSLRRGIFLRARTGYYAPSR